MAETMYDCYLSQFGCLERILGIPDGKETILAGFGEYYRKVSPDRVYLVGSGTSYNACAAAAPFLEAVLGIETQAAAPTSFGKLYGQNPLVIAVSQSGRSTNTVAFIERMRRENASVVTLTDPIETPVGGAGDFAVRLKADDEKVGPKTRGYMATVLTLYLMALEANAAVKPEDHALRAKHLDALRQTVAKGKDYLDACQRFYDAHWEDLKISNKYIFVGKGVSAKVALEDALKVLETLCFPAIGYEFEEFLHGPACCTDEGLAVFFYLPEDEDAQRMRKAAGILSEATKNCYFVSHNPADQGENVLCLPTADPAFHSPFTDILFGQLISAVLTGALGRKRHPAVQDIFTKMGTKTANI